MKYYKISISFFNLNDEEKRVVSHAKGNKIPEANYYFNEMNAGKIIKDAPIFDYFYLESFEKKKYWEDYLLDAFSFMGEGSQIIGWLVSYNLKFLLENFILPVPHHFYPSKLIYKRGKIDYYIFQYAGKFITDIHRNQYIDFSKSFFFDPIQNKSLIIKNVEHLFKEKLRIRKDSELRKKIGIENLVLNSPLDFFPMSTYLNEDIVSENLKNAIENTGITSFEFSELDYEVIVSK